MAALADSGAAPAEPPAKACAPAHPLAGAAGASPARAERCQAHDKARDISARWGVLRRIGLCFPARPQSACRIVLATARAMAGDRRVAAGLLGLARHDRRHPAAGQRGQPRRPHGCWGRASSGSTPRAAAATIRRPVEHLARRSPPRCWACVPACCCATRWPRPVARGLAALARHRGVGAAAMEQRTCGRRPTPRGMVRGLGELAAGGLPAAVRSPAGARSARNMGINAIVAYAGSWAVACVLERLRPVRRGVSRPVAASLLTRRSAATKCHHSAFAVCFVGFTGGLFWAGHGAARLARGHLKPRPLHIDHASIPRLAQRLRRPRGPAQSLRDVRAALPSSPPRAASAASQPADTARRQTGAAALVRLRRRGGQLVDAPRLCETVATGRQFDARRGRFVDAVHVEVFAAARHGGSRCSAGSLSRSHRGDDRGDAAQFVHHVLGAVRRPGSTPCRGRGPARQKPIRSSPGASTAAISQPVRHARRYLTSGWNSARCGTPYQRSSTSAAPCAGAGLRGVRRNADGRALRSAFASSCQTRSGVSSASSPSAAIARISASVSGATLNPSAAKRAMKSRRAQIDNARSGSRRYRRPMACNTRRSMSRAPPNGYGIPPGAAATRADRDVTVKSRRRRLLSQRSPPEDHRSPLRGHVPRRGRAPICVRCGPAPVFPRRSAGALGIPKSQRRQPTCRLCRRAVRTACLPARRKAPTTDVIAVARINPSSASRALRGGPPTGRRARCPGERSPLPRRDARFRRFAVAGCHVPRWPPPSVPMMPAAAQVAGVRRLPKTYSALRAAHWWEALPSARSRVRAGSRAGLRFRWMALGDRHSKPSVLASAGG